MWPAINCACMTTNGHKSTRSRPESSPSPFFILAESYQFKLGGSSQIIKTCIAINLQEIQRSLFLDKRHETLRALTINPNDSKPKWVHGCSSPKVLACNSWKVQNKINMKPEITAVKKTILLNYFFHKIECCLLKQKDDRLWHQTPLNISGHKII